MTSHQTRRPRPSRPSPNGSGGEFDDYDDDASLGARMRASLFRNPGRRGSIAAIGVGCALFVTAAIATPLAAAHKSDGHSDAAKKTTLHTTPLQLPTATPTVNQAAAPAGRKTLSSKPVHAARPAPVTKAVITGLAANGIPNVALNAYRVAAARMDHAEPSCGIDWALLAGIGREESNHGRFGGATLAANGVSSPPIVGPALDGIHWDFIPVSAQYISITGDRTYAHALGPMQFIPSTWAAYGADANGDGKADIFNINDAALGAARYLCAAGGDLRTHSGQVAAVLAYNHSDQYLAQVLALANDYRNGIKVTGIPVGNTTGSLPTTPDTGYVPPANPAPPTAVDPGASKTATSHPKPKTPAKTPAKGGKSSSSTGGSGSGSGSGSGGSGSGGTGGGSGSGGGTGGGVIAAPTSAAGGGGGGLLPTSLPTILPKPATSTAKPKPSATASKTCTLNLIGICI